MPQASQKERKKLKREGAFELQIAVSHTAISYSLLPRAEIPKQVYKLFSSIC